MKRKQFLPAAFALVVAAALTGCAKDYTCECTETFDGQSTKYTKEIKGATKAQAKVHCMNTTEDYDGTKFEYTCELK